MADIDVGETVTKQATYRTRDGAPADPSDVVVYIRDPSGDVTTGLVLHEVEEIGIYRVKIVADQSGLWRGRWESAGLEGAEQEEFSFNVRRRRVPDPAS